MDVQIPHSVHTEIQKENNLQSVQSELARNHKDAMQVQGSRNTRRSHDARPCTSAFEYSTKNKRVKFHGISQGKKRTNDV